MDEYIAGPIREIAEEGLLELEESFQWIAACDHVADLAESSLAGRDRRHDGPGEQAESD